MYSCCNILILLLFLCDFFFVNILKVGVCLWVEFLCQIMVVFYFYFFVVELNVNMLDWWFKFNVFCCFCCCHSVFCIIFDWMLKFHKRVKSSKQLEMPQNTWILVALLLFLYLIHILFLILCISFVFLYLYLFHFFVFFFSSFFNY